MIKLSKLIDILPYILSGGVEDMCSISVHLNSLYLFRINISPNMSSLINNQTGFSLFGSFMCKNCTEKSRAYDQIIIFFHVIHLLVF